MLTSKMSFLTRKGICVDEIYQPPYSRRQVKEVLSHRQLNSPSLSLTQCQRSQDTQSSKLLRKS